MAAGSELCSAELALAGRATASWGCFLDSVCLERNVCLPSSELLAKVCAGTPSAEQASKKKEEITLRSVAHLQAAMGC